MARFISRILSLEEFIPQPPPPPRIEPAVPVNPWRRCLAVPFLIALALCGLLLFLSVPVGVFAIVALGVWKLLAGLVVESPPRRRGGHRRRWGPLPADLAYDETGRLGMIGEVETLRELARLGNEYVVLHDVNVPTATGSTQLDVVLVAPGGVWCLEVKAWAGRVFGQEAERTWTQVKRYGREVIKDRRANPVQQNEYHCRALGAFLADLGYTGPVRSVIVFTVADLRTTTTTPVVALPCLASHVQSGALTPALSPEQVTFVAGRLRHLIPDPAQRPAAEAATLQVELDYPGQERWGG